MHACLPAEVFPFIYEKTLDQAAGIAKDGYMVETKQNTLENAFSALAAKFST